MRAATYTPCPWLWFAFQRALRDARPVFWPFGRQSDKINEFTAWSSALTSAVGLVDLAVANGRDSDHR